MSTAGIFELRTWLVNWEKNSVFKIKFYVIRNPARKLFEHLKILENPGLLISSVTCASHVEESLELSSVALSLSKYRLSSQCYTGFTLAS